MSTSYDFNKLVEANELLWKWGQRFKIQNASYLNFVYRLKQDKDIFIKKIKSTNQKKEFKNDCQIMFYAADVENDLVKQYRPVVLAVLRRFKIQSQDIIESAYDVGISSLRGAIWRYRLTRVKFLSYVMTGVMLAVKGYIVHKHVSIGKKPKKITIPHDEDTNEMFTNNIVFMDRKIIDPAQIICNGPIITDLNIGSIAKLNEDENMLIKLHLERSNYREAYAAYYYETYKKRITKHKINDLLISTKRKLYVNLKRHKGVEFMSQFKEPAKLGH